MNKFNFALIALAAATFAGQASATYCSDNSKIEDHPNGNCSIPIGGSGQPGNSSSTSSAVGAGGGGGGGGAGIAGALSGSVSGAQVGIDLANKNLSNSAANVGPIKNTATGGTAVSAGGTGLGVGLGGNGGIGVGGTGGTSSANGTNLGINGQSSALTGTVNGTNTSNVTAGTNAGAGAGANAGAGAGAEAGKNAGANAGAGAGANAGAGAGSNNATTQNTTVNTGAQPGSGSTSNYSSKVIVHPSMIPAPPVTLNPQGNLLAIQTGCSMIVNVQPVPVYATSQGFWGGTEQVQNGNNYLINPVYDEYGVVVPFLYVPQADGSKIVIGNQLIVGMSITNQSIAVSGALGLIKSSGSGGQVGGGVSSSLQQMGDRVIAVPCMAGIIPAPGPLVVEIEKEVEVLVERKTPRQ